MEFWPLFEKKKKYGTNHMLPYVVQAAANNK